ncbi:MAG TPA: lactate racemase domain-containing protein [Anaerohalosphaeraceae bacterium]|nr:lactate racemase domain-containing protein [Anaerohalosphaeraceae bacterium]HRT49533.1 lactate racemase domain-containing protein [Anaerohalosphaeraceae bacterium]
MKNKSGRPAKSAFMNIELHYGEGFLNLSVPDANVAAVIRPWVQQGGPPNEDLIAGALAGEAAASFQRAIRGRTLAVLVADGSRDMPVSDIFGPLFAHLRSCARVRFAICTGTHDADTPENRAICQRIEAAARRAGLRRHEIVVHDCQTSKLSDAGRTSRGTDVQYNRALDAADAFLVLSDVKFHYFAGYSNPIKNFVPGLCSYRTAEQNHSLALEPQSTCGLHPWQADPARRNNPLAADQLEAMRRIVGRRLVYALVTISSSGRIQWARFGDAEEVTRHAFTESDLRNTHTVEPTNHLIVSPGGLPNDVDLYISQRALELTQQAVCDGGEVLFLTACPKGIGHARTMENFYNRLVRPLDEIFASIRQEYKLFSHKPYKFARMIQRLGRIWVHSQIPDNQLIAVHLHPAPDPQAVVDAWLVEDPTARITVVNGANKLALYSRQAHPGRSRSRA